MFLWSCAVVPIMIYIISTVVAVEEVCKRFESVGEFLCGRDRCACCLGILLGSRPVSLLSGGCILSTYVVAPAFVASVADILRHCHVYVLVCGGCAVLSIPDDTDLTVAAAEEGIAQLMDEDSWLSGRLLSMPSWVHSIYGMPAKVFRSSPSWRGDFLV